MRAVYPPRRLLQSCRPTDGLRTFWSSFHPRPGPSRHNDGRPSFQSPALSIHVALNHVTHYRYDRDVELSPQLVRLRPAPHCRTRDPRVLAARDARRALHPLAAGSTEQLRGAARVPGDGSRVSRRDRPGRRSGRLQPLRLLPGAGGGTLSVLLHGGAAAGASPVPADRSADAALVRVRRVAAAPAPAHDRHARRRQPEAPAGCALSHPPRARRADAGADADARVGIVPRLHMASRAGASALRPRGALRVRIPHPARRRCRAARGSARSGTRLHRPSRMVRGLSPGRRLGRPRPDLRPARGRGTPAAGVHARSVERRAGVGRRRRVRGHDGAHDARRARPRVSACDQALQRCRLAVDPRARRRGRCAIWWPATCG